MEVVKTIMLVFYDKNNNMVGNFGSFNDRPGLEFIQEFVNSLDIEEAKKAAYCKIEEKFYLYKLNERTQQSKPDT